MCGEDNISNKERKSNPSGERLSAKQKLENWLKTHSDILQDPWEGLEWKDDFPVNDNPVVIDPTVGNNDFTECKRNKR